MRVAIFTDTFYPNIDGVVTTIINKTETLAKRGHKFLIVAPDYKKESGLKLNNNISILRIKSIPIPNYKEFRFVLPYYKKCLKEIKSFNPHLLHIETYSTLGIIGAKISKELGLPLIGTYHTIAAEFIEYLSLLNLLGIDKLFVKFGSPKITNLPYPKKEGYLYKLIWNITIKLYNNCDIVIAPSESIKELLIEKGIKRKISVISHGINLRLFNFKKRHGKGIRSIIYVGRLSFEKNIDLTIRAFSIIAKKYNDIEYTIIGDGPASNMLKNLTKKLGLENRVKFLGYIPHNKLPNYYKKSDFFITFSTAETQGLVILESMASGLPVIGVNKFAIPDIIQNGFNGFIVEPGDINGMAHYMEFLIKNPNMLNVLSKNAITTMKSHDLAKTSVFLEGVYKELTSRI